MGISRSSLLEKERRGVIPPPQRENRGAISFRFYKPEDIPLYRKILNSPPLLWRKRVQLFLNCQSGSGKSSIAANYLQYVSGLGVRCLAVDLDSSGSLSEYLGISPYESNTTIGQVLLADGHINGTALPVNKFLQIIPGNALLVSSAVELNTRSGNEKRLSYLLRNHKENYDLVVLDVNSHPDILMVNAVLAADDIIIPVDAKNRGEGPRLTLDLVERIISEYSVIQKKEVFLFENKILRSGPAVKRPNIKDRALLNIHYLKRKVRFDRRFEALEKSHGTAVLSYPRSGVSKDIKALAEDLLFE